MYRRCSNIKQGHIFWMMQAEHCRGIVEEARPNRTSEPNPANSGHTKSKYQTKPLKGQPNQLNPSQDQLAVPQAHSTIIQVWNRFFFLFLVPAILAGHSPSGSRAVFWRIKSQDPACLSAMTGNLESTFSYNSMLPWWLKPAGDTPWGRILMSETYLS